MPQLMLLFPQICSTKKQSAGYEILVAQRKNGAKYIPNFLGKMDHKLGGKFHEAFSLENTSGLMPMPDVRK